MITYSIPIPLKLYNTAIASTKLAVLVLYSDLGIGHDGLIGQ
jgi:hypothetical protein